MFGGGGCCGGGCCETRTMAAGKIHSLTRARVWILESEPETDNGLGNGFGLAVLRAVRADAWRRRCHRSGLIEPSLVWTAPAQARLKCKRRRDSSGARALCNFLFLIINSTNRMNRIGAAHICRPPAFRSNSPPPPAALGRSSIESKFIGARSLAHECSPYVGLCISARLGGGVLSERLTEIVLDKRRR